jgi:hypothetical protein
MGQGERGEEISFDSTPSRYSLRKLPRIDYAARLSSGLFPRSLSEKEETTINSEKGLSTSMKTVSFNNSNPPPPPPPQQQQQQHSGKKKSSQMELVVAAATAAEEETTNTLMTDDATTWTTQVLNTTHSFPSSPQNSFISRTHSSSTRSSSYSIYDDTSTPDLLMKRRSLRPPTTTTAAGKPTPSSRIRQWVNLLSPRVWKRESMIVHDEGDLLNSSSPVRPNLMRYRRTPTRGKRFS